MQAISGHMTVQWPKQTVTDYI